MIPTYFFIVLLVEGARSPGCQRALEWLPPTSMAGVAPPAPSHHTATWAPGKPPCSAGSALIKILLLALSPGPMTWRRKTPAQARVEHGSAATAFVLTKIDTLHGYHPADGSDRGAPHRRTAPTEQRRANPPAPPNQCLESLLPALRRAASRAYISSTISVNLFSTSRRRTLRVGVSSPLSVVNSSHNTRRSRICS